jgi:hypothetical protein
VDGIFLYVNERKEREVVLDPQRPTWKSGYSTPRRPWLTNSPEEQASGGARISVGASTTFGRPKSPPLLLASPPQC